MRPSTDPAPTAVTRSALPRFVRALVPALLVAGAAAARLHQRVRDVGMGERMPQEPPTLQF